ncbi:LexA family protein [Lonsdalea quercina]|uniref:LexA family protein n=1 Tax=Lonsdalea quercina TaxID=71657 RepID=UPI003976A059
MKMKWYELAKSRMKDLDINQEKLAEHLGITKGAVSHWLNARREPSLDDIAKILRFLGMREFTVNFDGTISSGLPRSAEVTERNFTYAGKYEESPKYPVISSVQAGAWAEAIEPYTLNDISLWLESDAKIQGKAFWLLVEGDSMTAPTGVSVPQGSYVLFDTGREAINGSLVVAKLSDSNEATFKKLVEDGGNRYLKGLNPNWPIITINGNCKIIGVAVESKMRFV